ncbi:MAG: DUF4258 domain-containing protein [Candidatus Poribacteria bacterium]|nr:DUF4258 domain-containing protein [Candidatus Poribacteria bacterium]
MFERILNRIREKVRTLEYVMSIHAEEEMNDDGLTIYDIEHVLLNGEIVSRQKDLLTGEWKYLVEDRTLGSEAVVVVTKLSLTSKLVIITVYVE